MGPVVSTVKPRTDETPVLFTVSFENTLPVCAPSESDVLFAKHVILHQRHPRVGLLGGQLDGALQRRQDIVRFARQPAHPTPPDETPKVFGVLLHRFLG